MRRLAAFAATAIALAVSPSAHAQCAPVDPLPNPSVGRVDGTRAFLGVSLDGKRLRAYVCDGTAKRKATILQWFNGRRDGRRPLRLRAGGHLLQITSRRAGGVIRGRLLPCVRAASGQRERRRRGYREAISPANSPRGSLARARG